MQSEACLESVGIKWKGKPNEWKKIPRNLLPNVNAFGQVYDNSGVYLFRLSPIRSLGSGTFGIVDEFERTDMKTGVKGIVAMKRTKHPNLDLFYEALFQHRLHEELKPFGLELCVPKVYDIFQLQTTKDVCFTMKSFTPKLLSDWCIDVMPRQPRETFALLVIQVALLLEVFEKELFIDHRDLKINNILIVDEPLTLKPTIGGKTITLHFPFHVVFVDFGFACLKRMIDCREGDGLPPFDPCPKTGRDIFQVLASIWSLSTLRGVLEAFWGGWIRTRLSHAKSGAHSGFVQHVESCPTLDWMYTMTDAPDFHAPLCAPTQVIQDLLPILFPPGSEK